LPGAGPSAWTFAPISVGEPDADADADAWSIAK
jgi:hypothetical protein